MSTGATRISAEVFQPCEQPGLTVVMYRFARDNAKRYINTERSSMMRVRRGFERNFLRRPAEVSLKPAAEQRQ